MTSLVVHVPHSSLIIPPSYRQSLLLTDFELWQEQCRMTDYLCDDLFDYPGQVTFPISRLVCDVERFRDDNMEPCARTGHGLMYTKTSIGKKMRENDPEMRQKILKVFYDPHHKRLEDAVSLSLASNGYCVILDGHSFNSKFPIKLDCLFRRPDFCIGTDKFHTPPALAEGLKDILVKEGFSVRYNTPYSGAITPMAYYGKEKRVASVMIEVNRRLYMNEKTLEKKSQYPKVKEVCQTLLSFASSFHITN